MSSGVDMGGPVTAMATVGVTAGVGDGGAVVGLGEGETKGVGEGEGLVITNAGVGEICRAVGVALGTPASSRGPVIKTAAFKARRIKIPTPIAAASPLFTRDNYLQRAGRPPERTTPNYKLVVFRLSQSRARKMGKRPDTTRRPRE